MRPPRGLPGRCLAAAALVLLAGGVHAADTARITPPAPEARVHVVARGDTLSGIAVRYGVSVAALVTANRLPSERATLKVGQRLTVPPATAAPAAPRRPSSALALATPRPDMIREPRACCRPLPCCGPRNLMLFVPEFVMDAGTSQGTAKALGKFLSYALGAGQDVLGQLQYGKLPSALLTKAKAAAGTLTCNGQPIGA